MPKKKDAKNDDSDSDSFEEDVKDTVIGEIHLLGDANTWESKWMVIKKGKIIKIFETSNLKVCQVQLKTKGIAELTLVAEDKFGANVIALKNIGGGAVVLRCINQKRRNEVVNAMKAHVNYNGIPLPVAPGGGGVPGPKAPGGVPGPKTPGGVPAPKAPPGGGPGGADEEDQGMQKCRKNLKDAKDKLAQLTSEYPDSDDSDVIDEYMKKTEAAKKKVEFFTSSLKTLQEAESAYAGNNDHTAVDMKRERTGSIDEDVGALADIIMDHGLDRKEAEEISHEYYNPADPGDYGIGWIYMLDHNGHWDKVYVRLHIITAHGSAEVKCYLNSHSVRPMIQPFNLVFCELLILDKERFGKPNVLGIKLGQGAGALILHTKSHEDFRTMVKRLSEFCEKSGDLGDRPPKPEEGEHKCEGDETESTDESEDEEDLVNPERLEKLKQLCIESGMDEDKADEVIELWQMKIGMEEMTTDEEDGAIGNPALNEPEYPGTEMKSRAEMTDEKLAELRVIRKAKQVRDKEKWVLMKAKQRARTFKRRGKKAKKKEKLSAKRKRRKRQGLKNETCKYRCAMFPLRALYCLFKFVFMCGWCYDPDHPDRGTCLALCCVPWTSFKMCWECFCWLRRPPRKRKRKKCCLCCLCYKFIPCCRRFC